MADRENVISHLQIMHTWASFALEKDLQFFTEKHMESITAWTDETLELLTEQETLLREYEKLSQVCFKIEKYLRIADLSILIDRIEEGKVEVLQDDGRLHNSPIMETTIKIRRL